MSSSPVFYYVYLITNKQDHRFYIGCRKSNVRPSDDLGKRYFSSSSDTNFLGLQRSNPSIFTYTILEQFQTYEEAIEFECQLHNRYDVGRNPYFYNKAKQTSEKFTTEGTSLTDLHKLKISAAISGKSQTPEWIQKRTGKIKGSNNGMYNRTYLNIWVEKYGKELAYQKYEDIINKRVVGENNPCYGKYGKHHPASKTYALIGNGISESFDEVSVLIKRCHELGLSHNTLRQYSAKGKSLKGYLLISNKPK